MRKWRGNEDRTGIGREDRERQENNEGVREQSEGSGIKAKDEDEEEDVGRMRWSEETRRGNRKTTVQAPCCFLLSC